jgi:hypothetical protein
MKIVRKKIRAFAIGRQFMIEEHADVTEKVTDQDLVERTHREVEFRTSASEHYLTIEENEGAVEVDKTAERVNKYCRSLPNNLVKVE